jgi:hypothetical protein
MIARTLLQEPTTQFPGRARWAIQQLRQPGLIDLAVVGLCASDRVPIEDFGLPFSVGEKITYEVTLANGKKVGTSTMWICGSGGKKIGPVTRESGETREGWSVISA